MSYFEITDKVQMPDNLKTDVFKIVRDTMNKR